MAKNLCKSTRIHIYGGDVNEKRAFALIGFNSGGKNDNDSVVTLVRGEERQIPKLLRRFGNFTNEDVSHIMSMDWNSEWRIDNYGLIVRLA